MIKPQQLLTKAQQGLPETGLEANLLAEVLLNLKDWTSQDKFAGLIEPSDYRPLLAKLIETQSWHLLADSFYRLVPFGTGGRRGSVGLGPNRLNPYTTASSVYGHIDYLKQLQATKSQLSVVLAYDVRSFHDLKNVYPKAVSNPLLGLTSKALAALAARIYTEAGIKVYMLPAGSSDYLSTPELSFLIRYFKADGGLNVSASHNHPDDNGLKFYDQAGAQAVSPADQQLMDIIGKVKSLPKAAAVGRPELIESVTEAARRAFIDVNLKLRLKDQIGKAKFVFTGLHGTGVATVGRCLEAMGYLAAGQLTYVEKQCQTRSDFKHVKYCNPNPESLDALEMGIDQATAEGAELLLATDPDADRLGGASRDHQQYRFLSGNDLAIILTRWRLQSLQQAGRLPARPLVIKTLVTSELVSRIASSYQARLVDDLLVGFKYIAQVLDELEAKGRFRDFEASLDDFVIGVEQSNGFLLTSQIRDKDAAGAAVVLAELTDHLLAEGRTVADYLDQTYQIYGYHAHLIRALSLPGAAGAAQIEMLQTKLRASPPKLLAGHRLQQLADYQDQQRFGKYICQTDKSARNFLSYRFSGGLRIAIRPSGTEPALKIYFELADKPKPAASSASFRRACRQLDQQLKAVSDQFLVELLALVGIDLPVYGLAISDLVTLQTKQAFCCQFLPKLQQQADKATRPASILTWAKAWFKQHKQATRQPFEAAFEAYLPTQAAGSAAIQSTVWQQLA